MKHRGFGLILAVALIAFETRNQGFSFIFLKVVSAAHWSASSQTLRVATARR
jgi:hypothetical protein